MEEPVIQFHLNSRTGLPTYRQLVQQVRHVLRPGLPRKGGRLPTVKDVARQMAIAPNTVLNAYRALECHGLRPPVPASGRW
ncbi:GntR family transcriptional regulator [Streptomyces pseudovenezuelae]|uniref:hypothetical protein n=1 Tax=Streptomyces pseudovenezuelae TaxID=67350 RepID=UPI003722C1FD